MNIWKKFILAFFSFILIFVAGACGYAIKMYTDANDTLNGVYQAFNRKSSKRHSAVNIDAQEPFSVLLMGIDTGDLGRDEQGRSDTTMVVTINPKEGKSTMLSLSRDLLVTIDGAGNDKLNHAYAFGGASLAVDTVENLLDIPIDHYVSINMKGMKDLIDAVDGIEVNNLFDFELDGIELSKGQQYLNGEKGLAYARMRYEDPEGDIGRQKRQREVVEKIVRKLLSLNGLTNYRKILDAIKANVKTDLTWDDMVDIQGKYRNSFSKIESLQLSGSDAMINEVSYQVLDSSELHKIQTKLRKQLGLPENEEMTEQDTYYADYDSYGANQQYNSYYEPAANNEQYAEDQSNQFYE